ncbi:hypothetical protein LXA43DRAFT_970936 [Ganoderma leucocontextum]|nr:hypothetical protein LXA43DRAFT_970936 [Ganoderma leucocontextum]
MNPNQWIMLSGEELATALTAMLGGRPLDVERNCTYPCVVSNANKQSNVRVKIQPLIGTLDDGIYMRDLEIEKLGLNFTGMTVPTRHGQCRVFSGVRFRFPDDYNGGAITYSTEHVYELPTHVTNSARSQHTSNLRKHGIIGVPLIAKHVAFVHYSNMYIIDISVVTASPFLRRCFERMSPLNALSVSKSKEERDTMSLSFNGFPGNALNIALEVARRYSPPPWSVFSVTRIGHPIMRIAETCRVCKRVEGEDGVKLSICTKCLQEERPYRAVYCSRDCLSADWKQRHKAEHAGEREWDVEGAHDQPEPLLLGPDMINKSKCVDGRTPPSWSRSTIRCD